MLLIFLAWASFIPKLQCTQPQKAHALGCFRFLNEKCMFSSEKGGKKSPESEFCFVRFQASTVGLSSPGECGDALPGVPNT